MNSLGLAEARRLAFVDKRGRLTGVIVHQGVPAREGVPVDPGEAQEFGSA